MLAAPAFIAATIIALATSYSASPCGQMSARAAQPEAMKASWRATNAAPRSSVPRRASSAAQAAA